MKWLLIIFLSATFTSVTPAQKLYTKNGHISFYSKASLENIAADNNQVMSTLDLQSGQLQFSVLIKAFHFKKSLMETHFNENYMESDKYPKAVFRGIVGDLKKADFSKDGSYGIKISGDLTIHNITKNISATGTLVIKGGSISAESTLKIKPEDYKISIPGVVRDNIAESIDVTVSCIYDKKM